MLDTPAWIIRTMIQVTSHFFPFQSDEEDGIFTFEEQHATGLWKQQRNSTQDILTDRTTDDAFHFIIDHTYT